MRAMSYLAASGLTKWFGDTVAVDDASLDVREGETMALLGPSGCGKTTLLRAVAGLERPDRGTITVGGETLTGPGVHVPAEQRRIGMVFQDWALFPHMTVARNVAFGLGKAERGRVAEMLARVGLSGVADRYPGDLSGGQAQRVALARALAPRPRVLLFDEPFSNLDTELRAHVRSDVAALLAEVGITAVFVTHDQEEAFVVGDRVAVMREGRIVQVGTPSEVYEYPSSPWVATFVGAANVVAGVAAGGAAETVVGPVPIVAGIAGRCRVVIRPEHLMVGNGDDGVVEAVEFYGHDTAYDIALDGARLQVRGIAAPRFRPGDRVSVTYAGPRAAAFAAAQ